VRRVGRAALAVVAFLAALVVATIAPRVVLTALFLVVAVAAAWVLVAAGVAYARECSGAVVDIVRARHRAGVARLRADAARRHPAGSR